MADKDIEKINSQINVSTWDITKKILEEIMQTCFDENGKSMDDEYNVSKMSDVDFVNWAIENQNWVKEILDRNKSNEIDRIDIQKKQAEIVCLWQKCPPPFFIELSGHVPRWECDFPPDLERITLELHERYPLCDMQSPLVSACLSELYLAQGFLQNRFLPMLKQLVNGRDVTLNRKDFCFLIDCCCMWRETYGRLNNVCRLKHESSIISKAIVEMERVNADCSFLKDELVGMVETLKELKKNQFTRKEAFGALRAMQNGEHIEDNGPRVMTKKDFVEVFRNTFDKWHENCKVQRMPVNDRLNRPNAPKYHDPIFTDLEKIILGGRYKKYVEKGRKNPHYLLIDDLCEALEEHCKQKGYRYKNGTGDIACGIGHLIGFVKENANNSEHSHELTNVRFEEQGVSQ